MTSDKIGIVYKQGAEMGSKIIRAGLKIIKVVTKVTVNLIGVLVLVGVFSNRGKLKFGKHYEDGK